MGLAWPVDVRVQNAHGSPLRSQCQRDVDGNRRLAHAALAGGDRNNVLDTRDRLETALDRVRRYFRRDINIGGFHTEMRVQFVGDFRTHVVQDRGCRKSDLESHARRCAIDACADDPPNLM